MPPVEPPLPGVKLAAPDTIAVSKRRYLAPGCSASIKILTFCFAAHFRRLRARSNHVRSRQRISLLHARKVVASPRIRLALSPEPTVAQ